MIRRLVLGMLALTLALPAMAATELPRLVSKNGRHALFVDGAPFLMLGIQANNSSNYPAMLPLVWPMVERLHANTLEMPIAWEQIEPVEGKFDFSFVDLLVAQARERNTRLVLLWFGSWKNGNGQYLPEWVKTNPGRFGRKTNKDGSKHFALTPHDRDNLEADKKAFVALMRHLRRIDPDHTVIMVQPENEVGNWNIPRDYAPAVTKLFEGQVPAWYAKKLGKPAGTWTQTFGKNAEQIFTTYHYAQYIDEIAAAGKAELALPMYVNASLTDPFTPPADGNGVPSGGPNWNVIAEWRAAAPNIDLVAPDIYTKDWKSYLAYLDHYGRPDNALMIPETGHGIETARFFWPVLGKGAIGFAPFGMDLDDYTNYPLGAKALDDATLEAFAANYRLFKPNARAWAKIAFENPTWGAAKGPDAADQSTVMGKWKVTLSFEMWQFGLREWTWLKTDPHPTAGQPLGGGVIAQIGPDEFLISGAHVRFGFGLAKAAPGEHAEILRVEQGSFDASGKWVMRNVWNGDQTDYGLNFTARPVMLRVKMGSWK